MPTRSLTKPPTATVLDLLIRLDALQSMDMFPHPPDIENGARRRAK
ncbi:MAG: hypothetical protein GVY12_09420 [Bacteroidetes bacterium]|nr:hypothetical protein [Bacteroidota bacterium]